MFAINIPTELEGSEDSKWGPDQQDKLSTLVAEFKKEGDKTGLYLCALVEEQINYTEKTGGCRCQAMLYLGMALSHGAGAGDALAHILLPVVQNLISLAAKKLEAKKGLASRNLPEV